MTATHTCTIVIGPEGETCGAPAITSLPGGLFHECARHAGPIVATIADRDVAARRAAGHPRTRSTAPFLLVKAGRIVGRAHSTGPAVVKRAAKLGATIVPNSTVAR